MANDATNKKGNRAVADILVRKSFHQFLSFIRFLSESGYLTHQSGKWWEGSYQDEGFTHGMTHGKTLNVVADMEMEV